MSHYPSGSGSFYLDMDTEYYTKSEKYKEIAEKVISEHDDLAWIPRCVNIAYVSSIKTKTHHGGNVYGECKKVEEVYKAFIPYDFIIIIYDLIVHGMTDEQMELLLYHELLHVGINEKDGGVEYKVNPHDIEDFRVILEQYGLDWAR